ncbi:DUF2158 domain-containing protein [Aquimarina mytili]|uniref:DUF2158 domain-containing protein n=1 Tax=Aquimarina mytili TaxID=874423 RepID=A0A936ZXG1_9FLAO|nr:DUF2158 domain-containing protein [Aquimarina mytili]MBL0686092.1 DUF2158 domain-containing protein [Aquimarina mytili]
MNTNTPLSLTIGDLVCLQSGGPTMKVTSKDTENYVRCEWENTRGDHMVGDFPIHILKLQTI